MQENVIHVSGKASTEGNGMYALSDFKILNKAIGVNDIKEGFLVQTDDFAYIVDRVVKENGKVKLIVHPY